MTREIHIAPVLNGFVCTVGCQRVVFDDIAKLCDGLREYYKDPHGTEKLWLNRALNKTIDGPTVDAIRNELATSDLRRASQRSEIVALAGAGAPYDHSADTKPCPTPMAERR